jgi:cell shape determining protein, MreB/Mrl family
MSRFCLTPGRGTAWIIFALAFLAAPCDNIGSLPKGGSTPFKPKNMWHKFQGLLNNDIGIDLGTANTLVYVKNRGIVIREPSVVAIQEGTKRVLAVGEEAKRMLGRTPGNIVAIRPMKAGVIADFEITETMIRYFITKVHGNKLRKPRVVIAVPGDITEVEKRAVKDSATRAGARDVFLIEEPMAAAIGVGLPVTEPEGNMIVDIGGGTTDVALISLAGVVYSKSVRVGGDEMDNVIIDYLRRVYNLLIGERTAEALKINIGSASALTEEKTMEVKGRDLVVGVPKSLTITSEEIREALSAPVSNIVDTVSRCLENTPPELASDLYERGMVLAGGGAMLAGLDELIAARTGLPVHIAEDPLTAVADGCGLVLDELDWFREAERRNGGRSRRQTPRL